jgi:hypothetical protein
MNFFSKIKIKQTFKLKRMKQYLNYAEKIKTQILIFITRITNYLIKIYF